MLTAAARKASSINKSLIQTAASGRLHDPPVLLSKQRCMTVVAAAGMATAIAAANSSSEESSSSHDQNGTISIIRHGLFGHLEGRNESLLSPLLRSSPSLLFSLFTLPHQIQRVHCQERSMSEEKSPFFGRLFRRRTVKKMEKTATRETLRSKYDVNWESPLGEGSFGVVYLGTDKATGEKVAIKKIYKKYTDRDSFKREMDALMKIRESGGHPQICGLRENFDEKGYYFLVLDLISGGEMFDHLCTSGSYSEADAARLVREVASALAFIHGIGIVHGDLKPENLMLSSDNQNIAVTKVVDFGCAQLIAEDDNQDPEEQSVRTLVNTPAYTPPEVLALNQRALSKKSPTLDPSFDMWALGVILYIMLLGAHPFDLYGDATDEEIEKKILSGKTPPLRKMASKSHLSSDAVSTISKLMQRDPNQRLSALELLEDPWVRGETARTQKIADSDKRLSAYRAFKTKIEAKVFADMVSFSDLSSGYGNEIAKRTNLIERSFLSLNPDNDGCVSTADLIKHATKDKKLGGNIGDSNNQSLSLSGFSNLLSENMKDRYFSKGQVIYNEGDKGDVMYFLNSGTIEVYTKDGFSKKLSTPGEVFGEGALIDPRKIRSASTRCSTPVHAIEVTREYFEKYLAKEQNAQINLWEKDKARKRQRVKTILRLQQSMKELDLRKGEFAFNVGEKGDKIWILEEGKIDCTLKGNTLMSLKPGEMFGEQSLILRRPFNFDAQCVSGSCKLHTLRANDFYALLDARPSMKESVRDKCLRREFQKALCLRTKTTLPRDEVALKSVFDGVNMDGTGSISLDNVRSMLRDFDPTYSEKELSEILNSLDLDDSGGITWAEFRHLFGMAQNI